MLSSNGLNRAEILLARAWFEFGIYQISATMNDCDRPVAAGTLKRPKQPTPNKRHGMETARASLFWQSRHFRTRPVPA
jgi:hypothetical protein